MCVGFVSFVTDQTNSPLVKMLEGSGPRRQTAAR
jgi:hypothetical protein